MMTPLGHRLLTQLLKGTLTVLRIHSTATPTATLQPILSLTAEILEVLHSYNILTLLHYMTLWYMILLSYNTFRQNRYYFSLEIRKPRLREVKKKLPKVLQLKDRRIQVLQLLIQRPFFNRA